MNERAQIQEQHERLRMGAAMLNKIKIWDHEQISKWDRSWSLNDLNFRQSKTFKEKLASMMVGDEFVYEGSNKTARSVVAKHGKEFGFKFKTRKIGRKRKGVDVSEHAGTIITRIA